LGSGTRFHVSKPATEEREYPAKVPR
jgi:hypothetical protein